MRNRFSGVCVLLILLLAFPAGAQTRKSFQDIPRSSWVYSAIERLVDAEIAYYPDVEIAHDPSHTDKSIGMTRYEFAVMTLRADQKLARQKRTWQKPDWKTA